MSNVVLIVIYNHQYNQNIEIIEQIYKDRFENIYHLVPFYIGEKSNVISVYECSHYFQGYIAQGFKRYFKEKFEHYFFVADDMILNPFINQNNYKEYLKLSSISSFIPELITLHKRSIFWKHTRSAFDWNISLRGVEAKNQLPDHNEALKLFEKFNLKLDSLKFEQIYKKPKPLKLSSFKEIQSYFYWQLRKYKNSRRKYNLSYPMVGSYSDIFVVSSDSIKNFCHYCGVFATTKLFVEIAVPTALILSSKEIVTEKNLKLQGKALWSKEEYQELDKYSNSLKKLLSDFPNNNLYLHPIKLSKWNTKL